MLWSSKERERNETEHYLTEYEQKGNLHTSLTMYMSAASVFGTEDCLQLL